jgi:hypothetical protein
MKLEHKDQSTNHLSNPNKQYGDKTFKISGKPIEVIQALAYVKALGGGHLYIGLGLIPPKSLYYQGHYATPEWNDRLSQEDFDVICSLAQNQKWVKSVTVWTGQVVDHDLDKIDYTTDMDNRFNMHPMDRFGKATNVHWTGWQQLRLNSWLDIPAIPGRPPGKGVVFAGTGWQDRSVYAQWSQQGIGAHGLFVGTQEEHQEFESVTGIKTDLQPVSHPAELAQWISGMNQVICTPNGWACAIAQGLGKAYMVQTIPELSQWNNPYVMAERGNNGAF